MKNKLIVGTAQFGMPYGINNSAGQPTLETISSVLDYAWSQGIQTLDTAEAYGNSQEMIGAYHRQSPHRFQVITKFSAARKDLPASLSDRVQNDLTILGVDQLLAYMYHSYSDFQALHDGFAAEIRVLKKNGRIAMLGVSVYTNEEFEGVLEYGDIDLIQLPFNALDNLSQRSKLLNRAKLRGKTVHTRSVYLQGLFFKRTGSTSN